MEARKNDGSTVAAIPDRESLRLAVIRAKPGDPSHAEISEAGEVTTRCHGFLQEVRARCTSCIGTSSCNVTRRGGGREAVY